VLSKLPDGTVNCTSPTGKTCNSLAEEAQALVREGWNLISAVENFFFPRP
jgi:hypothetical protein